MLVDDSYRYRISDFDLQVFDRFVSADHPLMNALGEIDWERLRPTVEACYSQNKGQPAIDPVRMLKLKFLRYLYNLSDRQVMRRLETDLAFRYFLQVGCVFPTPISGRCATFEVGWASRDSLRLSTLWWRKFATDCWLRSW